MSQPQIPHRSPVWATRRGHGALILVVLIAIAIGIFLMFGNTGGGTSYVQQVGQTKQRGVQLARELETRQLAILIAHYRTENNNKLPRTPEDLDAVAAFRDPWGNTMSFSFEEPRNGPVKVTFKSAGPDGEMGTEDDVVKVDTLPF